VYYDSKNNKKGGSSTQTDIQDTEELTPEKPAAKKQRVVGKKAAGKAAEKK
jgi:hypothetical protein